MLFQRVKKIYVVYCWRSTLKGMNSKREEEIEGKERLKFRNVASQFPSSYTYFAMTIMKRIWCKCSEYLHLKWRNQGKNTFMRRKMAWTLSISLLFIQFLFIALSFSQCNFKEMRNVLFSSSLSLPSHSHYISLVSFENDTLNDINCFMYK